MKKLNLKIVCIALLLASSTFVQAQTTVNLAQQCDCEVKKPGTEVTAGATTPAGTNTGDLLIDASGDIFYWDGDSWEVPTTSSSGIQAAGTEVTAGATIPAGTNTGDLLVDPSGDIFYWDGDSWELSSAGGSTPWNNPDGTPANQSSTDINYMGGKVGVGTTTPTTDFSVIGGIDNTFNIVSTRNIAGNLFHHVYNQSSDASAYAGHILGNDQNPDAANIYLGSSNASTWAGPNSLNISNNLNAPTSFWTNGAERMRITPLGRIGIGTTTPTSILTVEGTITNNRNIISQRDQAGNLFHHVYNESSDVAAFAGYLIGNDQSATAAKIYLGSSNATAWGGANSLNIVNTLNAPTTFRTNGAERMRITASGAVGIGTTDPKEMLTIGENGHNLHTGGIITHFLNAYWDGANSTQRYGGYGGGSKYAGSLSYDPSNGKLRLGTSSATGAAGASLSLPAHQFVLTPNGKIGLGTSNPTSRFTVHSDEGGYIAEFKYTNSSTDPHGVRIVVPLTTPACNGDISCSEFLMFTRGNSNTGRIRPTTAGTGVQYNTTSDKRLKHNIQNTALGLSDLMKISIKDYTYKSDPSNTLETGLLAQELYEVFPDAVSVGSDDLDEDGQLSNPWQVDYGRLTPLLIKSVQDQQAQIEAQQKEIDALKAEREQYKAQAAAVTDLQDQLNALKAMIENNNTESIIKESDKK